jgi:hypothetical protein
MSPITFQINFEEDNIKIRNNFILYCTSLPLYLDMIDSNSNGYASLELNIEDTGCGFVSCLQSIIKDICAEVDLDSNEYHVLMRVSTDFGSDDENIEYCIGEYIDIENKNNTVSVLADYSIRININKTNEILNITTNLNHEDIKQNYPDIQHVIFLRPNIMNGYLTKHDGVYYNCKAEDMNDCKCKIQKGMHIFSFEFVKKSYGEILYPKLHEVLLDNCILDELHSGYFDNYEEIKPCCFCDTQHNTMNYKYNITMNNNLTSCDNILIDSLLKKHDLTYQSFIHSLFPGIYEDALIPEENYDEDINCVHDGIFRCVGEFCIHDKIKNIMKQIIKCMIENNKYVFVLKRTVDTK